MTLEWREGRTPGPRNEMVRDLHPDGYPAWWETTDRAYTVQRDHPWDGREPDVYYAWQRSAAGEMARPIPGRYRTLGIAQRAVQRWHEQKESRSVGIST